MFVERVNRFNVITESSELVNKNIQQINLCLLEVHFVNDQEALFVIGSFGREIRYLENDGRARKMNDQIQFAICMGESFSESLSLLKAELKQDYFIFQGSRDRGNAAILEQGLLIIVRKVVMTVSPVNGRSLLVNSIIKQGQDNLVLKIPVTTMVSWSQPKCFSGTVRFADHNQPPVIDAEIIGAITYRTAESVLQEMDLREAFSLLVNAPAPSKGQSFVIGGVVKDVRWLQEGTPQNWIMKLKLDYQWDLIEPKELICEECFDQQSIPTEQIQTLLMLDTAAFDFSKTLLIPLPALASNIQVDLEQVSHTSKATTKGHILSVNLTWGIVFVNSGGYEQYQEFQSPLEELFSGYSNGGPEVNLSKVADLKVNLINFAVAGQEIVVNINCQYSLKTYRRQITAVLVDQSSPELIYAKTLVGKELFSLTAAEVFNLKHLPLQVVEVKAQLLTVQSEVKNGWLDVKGQLEVNIVYIDQKQVFRTDLFQSSFQEHYIWDQLHEETEVVINGRLDHDTYRLMNMSIIYNYLLSISTEAFCNKELRIAAVKEPTKLTFQNIKISNQEPIEQSVPYKLIVEGELPITQGFVKEIATSRTLISGFDYRNSDHAILVSGTLLGELEYWDQEQYLHKVPINLPFWRFIRNDSGVLLERCKLIPQVTNCSCILSQTWFWWKRSVKIRIELELKQVMLEGEIV